PAKNRCHQPELALGSETGGREDGKPALHPPHSPQAIGRSGRAHGTLRHRASLSRARVEKQREPTKPSSKWRGPDLVAGPAKKLRHRPRLALEPETGDLEANPPALHPTDRPQAIGPNP